MIGSNASRALRWRSTGLYLTSLSGLGAQWGKEEEALILPRSLAFAVRDLWGKEFVEVRIVQ